MMPGEQTPSSPQPTTGFEAFTVVLFNRFFLFRFSSVTTPPVLSSLSVVAEDRTESFPLPLRHSREGGLVHRRRKSSIYKKSWTPAFAGVTTFLEFYTSLKQQLFLLRRYSSQKNIFSIDYSIHPPSAISIPDLQSICDALSVSEKMNYKNNIPRELDM